jgi:hypothetical protein
VSIEHAPPRSDSSIAVERFHIRVLVFVLLSIHWFRRYGSDPELTLNSVTFDGIAFV